MCLHRQRPPEISGDGDAIEKKRLTDERLPQQWTIANRPQAQRKSLKSWKNIKNAHKTPNQHNYNFEHFPTCDLSHPRRRGPVRARTTYRRRALKKRCRASRRGRRRGGGRLTENGGGEGKAVGGWIHCECVQVKYQKIFVYQQLVVDYKKLFSFSDSQHQNSLVRGLFT